jgi:hypothetical protein
MGFPDAPGMVSVGEFAFRNAMKVALTALRDVVREAACAQVDGADVGAG